MSAKPLLVMQMRRMGDLILTFPLLEDLRRQYPHNPLWVAAQPYFYEPLLPFAPPGVRFFSQHDLPALLKESFEMVINLGGPRILAHYAAQMSATAKLGQLLKNDSLRIQGYWHLYRESLTANNRHNAFHWGDLFRMDSAALPLSSPPAPTARNTGRIGLFLGASEAFKRPEPLFWSRLARKLAHDGHKPVFLGGPGEILLGREAMAHNTPALNLCGKTTVAQLGDVLKNLDLLITPDTGPMHLANFLQAPVLDLSMGNVHAQDTGPTSAGQYVLASSRSCAGCWQCEHPKPFCKDAFIPFQIAKLASAIVKGETHMPRQPGLRLLRVARDESGLHCLEGRPDDASTHLDNFWKAVFCEFSGAPVSLKLTDTAQALKEKYPGVAASVAKTCRKMLPQISQSAKYGLPEHFWEKLPRHSRLFAGNMEMSLQNEDFHPRAIKNALGRVEKVVSALS